jgi:hypothetical protein
MPRGALKVFRLEQTQELSALGFVDRVGNNYEPLRFKLTLHFWPVA